MADLLIVAGSQIVATAAGLGWMRCFVRTAALSVVERLAHGFAFGTAWQSAALCTLGVIGIPLSAGAVAIVTAVPALAFVIPRRGDGRETVGPAPAGRIGWVGALLAIQLVGLIVVASARTLERPQPGVDALVTWELKAKALVTLG